MSLPVLDTDLVDHIEQTANDLGKAYVWGLRGGLDAPSQTDAQVVQAAQGINELLTLVAYLKHGA